MQDVQFSLRETFKYRDGWDYMDSWRDLGQPLRVTPERVTRVNEIDETTTSVRYLKVRRSDDVRLLLRAIEDSMSGSHCQHEYDCCGCWTNRTRARRVKPRLILIHTTSSRNI